MIKWFVCSDQQTGEQEARERGWLQIAARRFVENWNGPQNERHEIRLVTHLADFQWTPGLTLIRGTDFGKCAMCKGSGGMGKSSVCPTCQGSGKSAEAAKFEGLVAGGYARWWQEPPARSEEPFSVGEQDGAIDTNPNGSTSIRTSTGSGEAVPGHLHGKREPSE